MGYDSTATKYFTVAQAIAKRVSGLLDVVCYRDETGGYVQHVPGILDPAHAIPDIQIPEIQVPTMVPKVDVQVQADSAMAAPLAYYANALGAGATAIDMSMNQVCEQLELRPRLSSYTNTSCTYTILGTASARALPISLYGVRHSGQGDSVYTVMKKIQTIPGSTQTGQDLQFTVYEGETVSIYIYYKIICTPGEAENTYSAQLYLDPYMPTQHPDELSYVNKLIATVTISRSKAQDSTNGLQSPDVGGLIQSSSTAFFGYQLNDDNDRWLAQAFEQWNAVVNQKLTFSGRCSASITYHVCGQLIVYQSQFGRITQATPEQLKKFAIPLVTPGRHTTLAGQIGARKDSAQEPAAVNSLLTVKVKDDKAILCDLKPASDKTCQILNYNKGVLTLTPVSATEQGSFTILSCGNTGLTVIQAPLADAQGQSIILGANSSSMISIALPKEATTPGYALAWTGSEFINSAVVGGPTASGYYVALGGQTTGGDTGSVVTWSKVGVLPADKESGMYWVKSSGTSNEAYTLIKVTVPSDAPSAGHFLQVTQADDAIQFKYVDAKIPTTGDNQYLRWVNSGFSKGKVQIPVTTDPGQFLTWSGGKFGKSKAPPTVGAGEALTWTGTAWSTVSLTGVDAPTGDGYYMASPAGGLDNIGWTWVKAALVPAQATQKACLISIGADGKASLIEVGTPSETAENQALTYKSSSGFSKAAFALATDIITVTNTANSAAADASKAKSDAAEALAKAQQADSAAEDAKATANEASNAATMAQSTAEAAQTTANAAQTTASEAYTAAQTAQATADNAIGLATPNVSTTVNQALTYSRSSDDGGTSTGWGVIDVAPTPLPYEQGTILEWSSDGTWQRQKLQVNQLLPVPSGGSGPWVLFATKDSSDNIVFEWIQLRLSTVPSIV